MLFPSGSAGKKLACQDSRYKRHSFDPWVGRIPWRRNGNSLQSSCLENSMARGAWWATVHEVAESGRRISVRTRAHTHTRLGLNILKENYELIINFNFNIYTCIQVTSTSRVSEHTCVYYLVQKGLHPHWLHLLSSEGSQRKQNSAGQQ